MVERKRTRVCLEAELYSCICKQNSHSDYVDKIIYQFRKYSGDSAWRERV